MNITANDIVSAKKLSNSTSEEELLQLILSVIDLTTLNDTDTDETVKTLANKALQIQAANNGKTVAAVCVFPRFAATAASVLRSSGIQTACVAGMFPNGQSSMRVRLADVQDAVEQGADEIDMVISRGEIIAGNYHFIADEVARHKEACGKAHLKVILETGQLTLEQVRKAAETAIENGADFIKTSTGKFTEGATLDKSLVMLQVIKSYYEKTGKTIGFKPAGGIRTVEDAVSYAELVFGVLGKDWLTPDRFRIGASSLANDVLRRLSASNPKLSGL